MNIFRRYLVLMSLFATLPVHVAVCDIVDGSNAVDVLGQYDQSSFTDPIPHFEKLGPFDSPNKLGMIAPESIAVDTSHHRLFVTESGAHRIVVYELDSNNLLVDRIPDYVLGQPDFASSTTGVGAANLDGPSGVAYESSTNRLYVADRYNNRVLVFDVTAISNGEVAAFVLGQPNFTSKSLGTTATTFFQPTAVEVDSGGHRLFVSDYYNRRILVFNTAGLTNGAGADAVLGQADFTSNATSMTQSSVTYPRGLSYDATNQRLFVADELNRRVMIFDVSTVSNGEDAVSVLCQPNFTSATAGSGAAQCNSPASVSWDSQREYLYVVDSGNNRVTVFNAAPGSTASGMAALFTLGQSNLTDSTSGTTRSKLTYPRGVLVEPVSARVYVADTGNHRLAIFDGATIVNGEDQVDGLGQYDESSYTNPVVSYTKGEIGNGPNLFGLTPRVFAIDSVHHRLFVADVAAPYQRVLVFNLNQQNQLLDRVPDAVIGKASFSAPAAAAVDASTISDASGLAYDSVNDRLFVSDGQSHRVLVFDTAVITSGEAAVAIVGQVDFTSMTPGLSASQLSYPKDLAYDASRALLFVSDYENRRIMVFDAASISSGESAAYVLGQADFSSVAFSVDAATMSTPSGLAFDSTSLKLYAADSDANRVLVFDTTSLSNGKNAMAVLCQPDFTSSLSETTSASCAFPVGVALDEVGHTLFVADYFNNRVLSFDTQAITSGQAASHVLGQSTFTSSEGARDSRNRKAALTLPEGLAVDPGNKRLYVADSDNSRAMVFATGYDLTFGASTLSEATSNDGTIAGSISVSLRNERFAITSGALTRGVHYTIDVTKLPAGLVENIQVTSPSTAEISFTGVAGNHESLHNVSGMAITFLDAAFEQIPVSVIANSTHSVSLQFSDAPTSAPIDNPDPTPTPAPPSACFNGRLPAPLVRIGGRIATVTLPRGYKASRDCTVKVQASRATPKASRLRRIVSGKGSTTLSSISAGRWRFSYSVTTRGLGALKTSSVRSVRIR